MSPGQIINQARLRHGLSQRRLAQRVGTQQSAISRLESDRNSPSVETLELVLNAMGERLRITAEPLEREYDPAHLRATVGRPAGERLALGISWNRMAGRLAAVGRRARG